MLQGGQGAALPQLQVDRGNQQLNSHRALPRAQINGTQNFKTPQLFLKHNLGKHSQTFSKLARTPPLEMKT